MSPSVQDRSVDGSSKPVVLLMDEIKLADELLSDLSKKWDIVVSPLSLNAAANSTREEWPSVLRGLTCRVIS